MIENKNQKSDKKSRPHFGRCGGCQAFMSELFRHIGPDTAVVNVDHRYRRDGRSADRSVCGFDEPEGGVLQGGVTAFFILV